MSPIFQIINYSEDAGYVTVTRKYVNTSGSIIKTEYDTVIIGSSYLIPSGMSIDGYSFKEQSQSGTITVTGNITIIYTYLTYYGVILQCQTTSGTDIQATMTYELEGSTYTVGNAPILTNYEYQSSNPVIGSTLTITGPTIIYYYYLQTILYLMEDGIANTSFSNSGNASFSTSNGQYNWSNPNSGMFCNNSYLTSVDVTNFNKVVFSATAAYGEAPGAACVISWQAGSSKQSAADTNYKENPTWECDISKVTGYINIGFTYYGNSYFNPGQGYSYGYLKEPTIYLTP